MEISPAWQTPNPKSYVQDFGFKGLTSLCHSKLKYFSVWCLCHPYIFLSLADVSQLWDLQVVRESTETKDSFSQFQRVGFHALPGSAFPLRTHPCHRLLALHSFLKLSSNLLLHSHAFENQYHVDAPSKFSCLLDMHTYSLELHLQHIFYAVFYFPNSRKLSGLFFSQAIISLMGIFSEVTFPLF